MLLTYNRATWESYFDSVNDLYNCDVLIKNAVEVTLLTKANLKSFRITSRNSFVCDQIPTDECEIEIIGYDQLSSGVKSYLTTHIDDRNNFIAIGYKVNGTTTAGRKYLVVKSYKISRDGKTATFKFASPLTTLSIRAEHFEYGRIRGSNYAIYVGSTGTNGVKYGITRAELFPVRCLQNRKGIRYVRSVQTPEQDYEYGLKTFNPSSPDGNFNGLNVYDYDIDSDTPDKSNIDLYGAINGATSSTDYEDLVVTFTYSGTGDVATVDIDKDCFVKGYIVRSSGGGDYDTSFKVSVQNDRLVLSTVNSQPQPSSGTSMTWTTKISKLSLANPTDNSKAYIQNEGVPTLGSSEDVTIAYVRSYYANTNIISYEGRIDPTLEPLDIVDTTLDGVAYRVALEEVTINFNGGFIGSIKGRIIENV